MVYASQVRITESSMHQAEAMLSRNVKCLEIDASEAGDQPQKTIMGYHSTEFWKKLNIGVVTPADPKTVQAATKDLCRHFVAKENPALFMEKAAKLAAQFRNLQDGRLTELLVNHAGLQKMFTLDPNVRFDLQPSSCSSDLGVERSSLEKSPKSPKKISFFVLVKALFSWKMKRPKQPVTTNEDGRLIVPWHLSFSNDFFRREKDLTWVKAFISSVDKLTEMQALIFGPAFACLFVILSIETRELSGISEVAEEMVKLCDTALDHVPSRVAKIVGRLAVKMPPLKELTKLLSVYAEVKLPQIYFNTVAGGLIYARHKRRWSLLTKKDSVTFVLMSILRYHDDQTPLASSLNYIKALAKRRHCPELESVYMAFVEQNFPESWSSWKAFCCVENFDTYELGKFDPFWYFSRAFSDRVFDELSYERNHRVCNISAVVEDLLDNRPGHEYIYEVLVREKPRSLRISCNDLLLAEEICNVLRRELGEPEEKIGTRRVRFATDS